MKLSSDYITLEDKYGAHNYHPLPVVLCKGEGVFVWDLEGKKYYDCLSEASKKICLGFLGHFHDFLSSGLVRC